jgi:hypothetical protein
MDRFLVSMGEELIDAANSGADKAELVSIVQRIYRHLDPKDGDQVSRLHGLLLPLVQGASSERITLRQRVGEAMNQAESAA